MKREARFLRLPEVMEMTALSRSSIYRQIAAGTFPRQIQICSNKVGWVKHQIGTGLIPRLLLPLEGQLFYGSPSASTAPFSSSTRVRLPIFLVISLADLEAISRDAAVAWR